MLPSNAAKKASRSTIKWLLKWIQPWYNLMTNERKKMLEKEYTLPINSSAMTINVSRDVCREWYQVNYFSWIDSRKVTRARDKVKETGNW